MFQSFIFVVVVAVRTFLTVHLYHSPAPSSESLQLSMEIENHRVSKPYSWIVLPFNNCLPRPCHYRCCRCCRRCHYLEWKKQNRKKKNHARGKKYKRFYLKCACWLNRKYINWFRICCRYWRRWWWWWKWAKKATSHTQAHITFKWLLNCNIAHVSACALLRKMCSQSIQRLIPTAGSDRFGNGSLHIASFICVAYLFSNMIFFVLKCARQFNSFFSHFISNDSQKARKH